MIPRIAYFHWSGDGPPMSPLRSLSISSFVNHNPEWEVRLIRSDPVTRHLGLLPAHEADWTRYLKLKRSGGFFFETDTLFLAPVPEAWRDADMAFITSTSLAKHRYPNRPADRKNIYNMAVIGCVSGHPFMVECEQTCARVWRDRTKGFQYQTFGMRLLPNLIRLRGGLETLGRVFEVPFDALFAVDWMHTEKLWSKKLLRLPNKAVGLHWYGGNETSIKWERDMPDCTVRRIARKLCR